jgi:hypothetical protein
MVAHGRRIDTNSTRSAETSMTAEYHVIVYHHFAANHTEHQVAMQDIRRSSTNVNSAPRSR